MAYVLLTCRLLLGGVFVVSAASKLRGRAAFREFEGAARDMGAPARFLRLVALTVIGAECLIPPLLVAPPGGLAGLALASALLVVLTGAIVNVLRQNKKTSCACFGPSTAPIGRRHLVRNGALIAVAGLGIAAALGGAPAIPGHPGGIATAAFAALVGILLVVATDDIAALFTEPVPPTGRTDAVSDRRRRGTGGAVAAEPAAHLRHHPQAPGRAG
ncbi:MauE/DoxX family redox-associated membrane protein [Streptomyces sp. NPDC097640]|uniref:MauE/DoxX family redox-associated membrane protein n=1 Tax=Streptomyces sp. NPDC097640 TaxID=3157229 RepID=UPI003330FAE4